VGLTERISERSRRRKFRLFMEAVQPGPTTSVIDVGVDDLGYGEPRTVRTANFFEEFYPWRGNVTAVAPHEGFRLRERYPEVDFVRADGCELPFADGAFDVYFSNAVIEHVGGPDRQRRFIAEAVRVARDVFITTPNRRFPIEVHTRLPAVHWLPAGASGRVYEAVGKPWARDLSLLSPAELRALFPGGSSVRILSAGMTIVALAADN
jgi:SAM-dependent methyltransferase